MTDEGRIAHLEQRLRAKDRELRLLHGARRDLERALQEEQTRHAELRQATSVRVARWIAAPLRPLYRWRARRRAARAGSGADATTAEGGPRDASGRGQELVAALRAQHPEPGPASGPLVSIVIPTHDGEPMLARLLAALRDDTVYRSFEVIVVDNASGPATGRLLARDWGYPLRAIRNEANESYSAANNQGLAEARGDFVLLLNDDVEPITLGWLGAMVEAVMADDRRVASGAVLVYPVRPDAAPERRGGDLRVQHARIDFRWEDGLPRGINAGGGDPRADDRHGPTAVPAATAACLLVRRSALAALGGLTEGYDYGSEDVDLCLELRGDGGTIVVAPDAVLFHHEYGTQDRRTAEWRLGARARSRRLFAERWAPRLARSCRLDRIRGTRRWTAGGPPRVAIIGEAATTATLLASFGERGWKATPEERDADLVILLRPRSEPSAREDGVFVVGVIGVIDGDAEGWLEAATRAGCDLLVAPNEAVATRLARESGDRVVALPALDAPSLLAAAEHAILRPRVAIRTGAPDLEAAARWGDTHFARDFALALEPLGFGAAVEIRPDWDRPDRQAVDVVVHLRGLGVYTPKPAHLNVLWIINHPADVTAEECQKYDLVLVASDGFARQLRESVSVPVHVLHQATDTDRFAPLLADPALASDVLFVGSYRRQGREAVRWAAASGAPLQVYGKFWEGHLPPEVIKGEYFPNDRLAELYASAGIVLADHWADMREHGFVANRVFDALACGAFVISDHVAGMDTLLEDVVPTFRSRTELSGLIDRWLADPAERKRRAETGMRIVRARHSFAARATQFVELVGPLLRERRLTVEADEVRPSIH